MNRGGRPFRALIVAGAPQQAEALLQRLHRARLPVQGQFSSQTDRMAALLAEHRFDLILVRLGGVVTAADVAAAYRAAGVRTPLLVVDDPEGSNPVALVDLMAAGAEGLIRSLADGRLERLVEHCLGSLRAVDRQPSPVQEPPAFDDVLKGLIEHCGEPIALLVDRTIDHANRALLDLLGYAPGEALPAARLPDLAWDGDAEALDSRINRALLLEADDTAAETLRLRHRDGHAVEVGVRLHVMDFAGVSRVAVFLPPVETSPETSPDRSLDFDALLSIPSRGVDRTAIEGAPAAKARTGLDEGPFGDGPRLVLDEAAARVDRLLAARGARVLFEPIVSLKGDSQEHYGITVRFADGTGVPPTAGDGPSRTDIEHWAMERAMREQARQRKRGRPVACLLALSADSLQEEGLLIFICDTLREYQLRGDWLTFAIRATDAAAYASQRQALTDGLRAVRCRICIDDAGGSEPDTAAIAAMRPDFLRFTPELVAGLAGNTALQQRLLERVRMAQREGIRTLLAGVRNARSLALFWDIGIDFVQGDFLQEPLPDLDPRR